MRHRPRFRPARCAARGDDLAGLDPRASGSDLTRFARRPPIAHSRGAAAPGPRLAGDAEESVAVVMPGSGWNAQRTASRRPVNCAQPPFCYDIRLWSAGADGFRRAHPSQPWPTARCLPDAVDRYLGTVVARETPVQQRLRAETSRLPQGGMQIGADQGVLLAFLVRLIGARRAIEVGTFTGYSALAVAGALPPDGRLVCCDVSDEWTSIARRYWAEAGVADRIDLHLRPAQETLSELLRQRRRRRVRLRVHRRRQDRLRRLLRSVPRAAAPGRADRDRQRAVERHGRRCLGHPARHRGAARDHREDPRRSRASTRAC